MSDELKRQALAQYKRELAVKIRVWARRVTLFFVWLAIFLVLAFGAYVAVLEPTVLGMLKFISMLGMVVVVDRLYRSSLEI